MTRAAGVGEAGVGEVDGAGQYRLLEHLRWGGAPRRCPHCGEPGRCYLLHPADGSSRATRTGARTHRRVWKCGACRRQFSVLTGTVLHGTRLPLHLWTAAMAWIADNPGAELPAARVGVSAEAGRRVAATVAAAVAGVEVPGAAEPTRAPADVVPTLSDAACALISAVLSVDADTAAAIRRRRPARRRPRPQFGPTVDYGGG